MAYNQHLRKRLGDRINNCMCIDCFAKKCYSYEDLIFRIQSDYLYFKAYAEYERGHLIASHNLQEEATALGELPISAYALNAIKSEEDFSIVDDLKQYLTKNDFKFKILNARELQLMMH